MCIKLPKEMFPQIPKPELSKPPKQGTDPLPPRPPKEEAEKLNHTENMRTSEKGLQIIREFESLRLEAYLCPAGVWTIGYGHTDGVKRGDKITKYMAEEYLKMDARNCERALAKYVIPKINQNQFDALVSFTFNIGTGYKFQQSTLLKKVNANPMDESIAYEFSRWKHDKNGVELAGLVRRRKMEADLYFSKD